MQDGRGHGAPASKQKIINNNGKINCPLNTIFIHKGILKYFFYIIVLLKKNNLKTPVSAK
jgi:hypothetical protein